ncbi:hypothetical protein D9758_003188 [Tetrapyrgos nigripes]|uniref:Uncharacterized protein n=1 Tax=Tetrapyrgos nigripes TaxID=182062 RepID=A0A8H5LPW0_9AGAR|nr:hypothetical protein D9758_003188 [Tetrapyrgos nigripes]
MGGASSKAARKLPKRTDAALSASRPSAAPKAPQKLLVAEEHRNEVIDSDSGDPHFLSNLNRLGPVKVDHHMQAMRPGQRTRDMLESRMQSEREAFSLQSSPNRVQAPTLSYLLDKRKSTASKHDIEDLAQKYGLKVDKLDSVARYVTTPSIQGDSIVRTVGEDGEERISAMAVWIEPTFSKPSARLAHRASKLPNHAITNHSHKRTIAAISATVAAGYLAYSASKSVILNDSPQQQNSVQSTSKLPVSGPPRSNVADPDALHTLVWGSNASKTLTPDESDTEPIRRPLVANWLDNVALRDLVFHRNHAACIDARGDVYQWGKCFQQDQTDSKPTLTMKGKDIVQLQLSDNRLYALSSSGKIYASDLPGQNSSTGVPNTTSSWWVATSNKAIGSSSAFVEVSPRESLSWSEKFVSISVGQDHLLALTSAGRAFAHPITRDANSHGQLGFRKFVTPAPSPSDPKVMQSVELVPKSVSDPYAKASPFKRTSSVNTEQGSHKFDDSSVRNCPTVFEIPCLRDIKISRLQAGGRSSFALTSDGRVLGWGANEYGQIGLGPNVTMDSITVPTEVVLWRSLDSAARTKCVDVSAGGDLTCFTIERTQSKSSPSRIFEVLTCGNGQWGGLGNNVFTNAQGAPTKTRGVSGLIEYNDTKKTAVPIVPESVSVSPTGHVLLTLDTSAGETEIFSRRDLMVWGKNYDSELGNGKKSSSAFPTPMTTSDGERFMLRKTKAKEVRDLQGNVWKRGVNVEQRAVTGYFNSALEMAAVVSPALSSSSYDLADDSSRSRSSTTSSFQSFSLVGDDDEIVWSPSDDITSANSSEGDDFVILTHAQSPSGVSTPLPSISDHDRLVSALSNLSVSSATSSDVARSPSKRSKRKKKRAAASSLPGPSAQLTTTNHNSHRRKGKKQTGLGSRPIVDDISDCVSETTTSESSVYDEAASYITLFLSDPSAQEDSYRRLTFLQSLLIELGLVNSSLPASLTAAKNMLKSHAFLNIRDYLAVRGQGPDAIQQVMYPSRSALIRSIRKKPQSRASRDWVKEHGLSVLLVSCFH